MARYRRAPEEVVKLANELIEDYHDHLAEARIGFLFRDEAPVSAGRVTLGKTKKLNDEVRAYLNFDFIIWIAEDYWTFHLTQHQKRALIDHELCHCLMNSLGERSIEKHEVEEFNAILERYGMWWPGAKATQRAVQARFAFEEAQRRPVAEAVERDVLDQVSGFLGGEADDDDADGEEAA